MSTLEARCPHCQARFRLPADQAGKPARCGRCQQTFTPPAPAPAPAAPPVAAAGAPRPAAPKVTVRVLNAEPVAAPRPASPARPAAPARLAEPEPEPRPKFKPRKVRDRDRERRRAQGGIPPAALAGGMIGGGVFLVAVVGLGIYMLAGGSSAPTEVATTAATQPVYASSDTAAPPATTVSTTASPTSTTTSSYEPVPFTPPVDAKDAVRRVKLSAVYIRCDMGRNQLAMGSGFFAARAGYVITNAHVIGYGPKSIQKPNKVQVVVDSNGPRQRVLEAKIVGLDADEDLALLQVEGPDLPPPLPFGRAADLVETQEVVIFGYPLGEVLGKDISVNQTTVSSLRKENGSIAVVQVAGGMAPGNSGGPVTNKLGQVIGVSVAGIKGTQINFAIPAEKAESFARDQLASGGQIKLGKLTNVRPTTALPGTRPPGFPPRPPIHRPRLPRPPGR
jgi:serine protease Do